MRSMVAAFLNRLIRVVAEVEAAISRSGTVMQFEGESLGIIGGLGEDSIIAIRSRPPFSLSMRSLIFARC